MNIYSIQHFSINVFLYHQKLVGEVPHLPFRIALVPGWPSAPLGPGRRWAETGSKEAFLFFPIAVCKAGSTLRHSTATSPRCFPQQQLQDRHYARTVISSNVFCSQESRSDSDRTGLRRKVAHLRSSGQEIVVMSRPNGPVCGRL